MTNHLESFNGLFKGKYVCTVERGGRCLRLDILVKFLIADMLPAIFEEQRMEQAEKARLKHWVISLPGGEKLWHEREASHVALSPVAYFTSDDGCDKAAQDMLTHHQLGVPDPITDGFSFPCYSLTVLEIDKSSTIYNIKVFYCGLVDTILNPTSLRLRLHRIS
jgi:hypothetical protein